MAGRPRGPSQAELNLQTQQLELEKQRLALEQNASIAAATERGLLEQQLAIQTQAQEQQTNILREQAVAAAKQQQEYTSILASQQAEEQRAVALGKVESVRASAAEAQQLQKANFSLLRSLSYTR